MNATIAAGLITKIEDSNLEWVDVTAGLVRPITFGSKQNKGKTFTYPIACSVNDPSACDDTQLAALLPDESKRSILFIEGDRFPQRVVERGIGTKFVSRLRIVGWLNCEKLGGGCNCGDLAAQNIITALRVPRYNSDPIRNIRHTVVGGGPSKGTAIFSQYTFDEKRSQYLHFPFDFFAIDVETEFTILPGCEAQLLSDDTACWTAPVNPRRKYAKDFTCEELQDPTTGLTDEQLGVDCLDCAGNGTCDDLCTQLAADTDPLTSASCVTDANAPAMGSILLQRSTYTEDLIVEHIGNAGKTAGVQALICTTCLIEFNIYVNGVLDQTLSDVDPCADNTINISA